MVIPAAMFIEMAAEALVQGAEGDAAAIADEKKELHAFGDSRAQSVGATGVSSDFTIGYLLGLETARVLLAVNPKAVQAGVSL
jgi:hypothetical protein